MKPISLKRGFLAGAAVAGLMAASAAHAQSVSPGETTTAVDDIVVTAQLRAQDPIEVPFALTAYSGDFLENLGVQEFDQLSAFVPGFLVQNQSPNNPGFVMRGITSDSAPPPPSRACRCSRTGCRSPSRAAPMSNCSTWSGSRWPRGRSRPSMAAAP